VAAGHQIVVSAITYAELTFGAANKKASPKVGRIIAEFAERLDGIIAWDKTAIERSS